MVFVYFQLLHFICFVVQDRANVLRDDNRIGSSDIKDKSQLMEARKSVERQMERFKVMVNSDSNISAENFVRNIQMRSCWCGNDFRCARRR